MKINTLFALSAAILLMLTAGCITRPDSDENGTAVSTDIVENDCDENIDTDCDDILDSDDNCVNEENIDQSDFDEDGIGDACDTDIDDDGFINSNDFNDYGDGVLIFNWSFVEIDSNETYDNDSNPDLFLVIDIDWNGDGTFSSSYTSETFANVSESTELHKEIINPSENRKEFKMKVRIYDADDSSEELLDYVEGSSGQFYIYTVPLYQSYYKTEAYDGRDESKGLSVVFSWTVDTA